MSKNVSRKICWVGLLAFVSAANAATYYVSSSGNDANSCSQGSACKTFVKAYQMAAAGDTVEVAAEAIPTRNLSIWPPRVRRFSSIPRPEQPLHCRG